jgi:hypothetical protein
VAAIFTAASASLFVGFHGFTPRRLCLERVKFGRPGHSKPFLDVDNFDAENVDTENSILKTRY